LEPLLCAKALQEHGKRANVALAQLSEEIKGCLKTSSAVETVIQKVVNQIVQKTT